MPGRTGIVVAAPVGERVVGEPATVELVDVELVDVELVDAELVDVEGFDAELVDAEGFDVDEPELATDELPGTDGPDDVEGTGALDPGGTALEVCANTAPPHNIAPEPVNATRTSSGTLAPIQAVRLVDICS